MDHILISTIWTIYGGFLTWGSPSHHPFLMGCSLTKTTQLLGVPPVLETPIYLSNHDMVMVHGPPHRCFSERRMARTDRLKTWGGDPWPWEYPQSWMVYFMQNIPSNLDDFPIAGWFISWNIPSRSG